MNNYRKGKGLSILQCHWALVQTAIVHTKNQINKYVPHNVCNLHSWLSNKHLGKNGKACCYPSNHSNPKCSWKKPEEVTGWKPKRGSGYEISTWSWNSFEKNSMTPDQAINSWNSSPGHNEMMAPSGQME